MRAVLTMLERLGLAVHMDGDLATLPARTFEALLPSRL
jgi:hypothetical protein